MQAGLQWTILAASKFFLLSAINTIIFAFTDTYWSSFYSLYMSYRQGPSPPPSVWQKRCTEGQLETTQLEAKDVHLVDLPLSIGVCEIMGYPEPQEVMWSGR